MTIWVTKVSDINLDFSSTERCVNNKEITTESILVSPKTVSTQFYVLHPVIYANCDKNSTAQIDKLILLHQCTTLHKLNKTVSGIQVQSKLLKCRHGNNGSRI